MIIIHTIECVRRVCMRRLNITLPEEIVTLIDKFAKDMEISRSAFLRKAAEEVIDRNQKEIQEKEKKKRVRRAIEIQDRIRKKVGEWDGVGEVRKWRKTLSKPMS
jgi:metal-responsive CopG/Arc/MetJ family transcriptional regulator